MTDPQTDPSENIEELREQIDHTREELTQTVSALASKADVKSRAQATFAQARQSAQETVSRTQAERPWLVPATLTGLITLLATGVWLILHRRH